MFRFSCFLAVLFAVAFDAGFAAAQDRGRGHTHSGYIGSKPTVLEIDECQTDEIGDFESRRKLASEHFQRGSVRYEQGDYRGAIAEFVAAYCHIPEPTMLKNIAQAYERLVEYERAVIYLERYVVNTKESEKADRNRQMNRINVLRNLPARIQVATVPSGAEVTLSTEDGVPVATKKPHNDKPLFVTYGTYVMKVSKPGYEPVSETIDVKIGQPYSFYFQLVPKSGELRITATPESARIFVDERIVGIGSVTTRLPSGTYAIRVEERDYVEETQTVEIVPDETQKLVVDLPRKPTSGRRQLLIAGGVGGALWGGATAAVIGGENNKLLTVGGAATGAALGVGGVYFGVPDISTGSSSFIIGTTMIGAVEGAMLSSFVLCESVVDVEGALKQSCNERFRAGFGLAGGIGGLTFAAITAKRFRPSAGSAALVNSGALWGTAAGLLMYEVFDRDPRLEEPLILGGLNLGIAAGIFLALETDVSRGHVALIDLSGFAGTAFGVALVDVIQPGERSERLPHFALIGMTAGLITGAYLTRTMDKPSGKRGISPSLSVTPDGNGNSQILFNISGLL